MKICGIVVEYNPLHNGHIHHIQKARELTDCDVLVAVMSGNFVQRGEVSIIDKWQRAHAAILNGVDLVIELPYIYVTQSASQFAKGAIDLLKLANVDSIVFGSESNNIDELKEIAELNINVDHLKESMKQGASFVSSYGLLAGQYASNDILGIAYLKALAGSSIVPYTIQRTTNYHDNQIIGDIASATSIRKAIYDNTHYENTTPMKLNYTNFNSNYFDYLKLLLVTLSKEYLSQIFLVNEGIENHLTKCIKQCSNYDEFINMATTRRYTKARIQRICMNILNQISKQSVKQLPLLNYIRPLAFNAKGQSLLKILKEKEVNIASCFAQIPVAYRNMEYQTTCTYVAFLPSEYKEKVLIQELGGPIIT